MIPVSLRSNDSIGRIDLKGVHYLRTKDISMDKEHLEIGPDAIKVTYLFTNHSDKDVFQKVVFPVDLGSLPREDFYRVDPLFPHYGRIAAATSGGPDSWFLESRNTDLQFTFYKNEEPDLDKKWPHISKTWPSMSKIEESQPLLIVRAVDQKDQDVTEKLKKMGIPVSALFVSRMIENDVTMSQDMIQKLQAEALIEKRKGYSDKYTLLWRNTIHYAWQDNFPARKSIVVGHTYRTEPVAGSSLDPTPFSIKGLHMIFDSPDKLLLENKPEFVTHESVKSDPKAAKDFDKFRRTYQSYTSETSYVLATGKGWKGGVIKDFTLRILPKKGGAKGGWHIATNFPHRFEKQKDGSYECRIKNFKPTDEPLRVMWLSK
jgi:hypothetical protein